MARTNLSNLNDQNKLKKNLAAAFTGIEGLPTDIDLVNEVMCFINGKCKKDDPEPPKKTEPKPAAKRQSFMERRKAKKQKK